MNQLKNEYIVLGIMSGTSLDGVDLCIARFQYDSRWVFDILNTRTIPYSKTWVEKLKQAETLSGRFLSKLDTDYGVYLGKLAKNFIKESNKKVTLISSHGHTIFHEPHLNYSKQIGHGAYIAAESGIRTVSDIRSTDLAFGGQGAPLVPFGDIHLYPGYGAYLNIGGIANITIAKKHKIVAFDIAAANMVLNYISKKHFGKSYDKNGINAAKGNVSKQLLNQLNQFEYYEKTPPKSLGKEDIDQNILPLIDQAKCYPNDQLRTYVEHLTDKIIEVVSNNQIAKSKIMVSGGGAHNDFLIKQLSQKLNIILPDRQTIEFKEALIFAFLGLYRFLQKTNTISSVTGAKKPTSAGAIFEPSIF